MDNHATTRNTTTNTTNTTTTANTSATTNTAASNDRSVPNTGRGPDGEALAAIRPWADQIVDERGHDPRSAYVERYWLSVIGPTATLIMRRFADEFDRQPDGFVLDLGHTATTMGLSYSRGQHSPFGKALQRCVMFGLAQPTADGFAVRRMVPNVAQRHLSRLPDDVQRSHYEWARRSIRVDRRQIEQRLVEIGVEPRVAARASETVAQLAS